MVKKILVTLAALITVGVGAKTITRRRLSIES